MSGHGNHAEEAATRGIAEALTAAGYTVLSVDLSDSSLVVKLDKDGPEITVGLTDNRPRTNGRAWIENRVPRYNVPGYGQMLWVNPTGLTFTYLDRDGNTVTAPNGSRIEADSVPEWDESLYEGSSARELINEAYRLRTFKPNRAALGLGPEAK
jgi:hypothetical protein